MVAEVPFVSSSFFLLKFCLMISLIFSNFVSIFCWMIAKLPLKSFRSSLKFKSFWIPSQSSPKLLMIAGQLFLISAHSCWILNDSQKREKQTLVSKGSEVAAGRQTWESRWRSRNVEAEDDEQRCQVPFIGSRK